MRAAEATSTDPVKWDAAQWGEDFRRAQEYGAKRVAEVGVELADIPTVVHEALRSRTEKELAEDEEWLASILKRHDAR
jgi:hypothetical protein